MEAAIDEFAERGIESASYNKIIERSGLSKGTVYYYFDNKDSLLLTVLDEICDMFRRAIGDMELPDTKEKYWAAAKEYNSRAIRFFFDNPKVWRVLLWISQDAPNTGNLLDIAHEKAMRFMDELLAKGRELGAVRNDIPLETIQRLMHALGKVISSDIFGVSGARCKQAEDAPSVCGLSHGGQDHTGQERVKIETFIATMHDLGKRILTPKEDFACLTRF